MYIWIRISIRIRVSLAQYITHNSNRTIINKIEMEGVGSAKDTSSF